MYRKHGPKRKCIAWESILLEVIYTKLNKCNFIEIAARELLVLEQII